jgi:hypothetical protein
LGEDAPSEQIGQAEVRFVPCQRDPIALAHYKQADVYVHERARRCGVARLLKLSPAAHVAMAVGGIPEQIKGLERED